jgi:hypothetical protein
MNFSRFYTQESCHLEKTIEITANTGQNRSSGAGIGLSFSFQNAIAVSEDIRGTG